MQKIHKKRYTKTLFKYLTITLFSLRLGKSTKKLSSIKVESFLMSVFDLNMLNHDIFTKPLNLELSRNPTVFFLVIASERL